MKDADYVIIASAEGDHDKEVNLIRDFLKDRGADWTEEKMSEGYGGDCWLNGCIQAVDVTVEYITFHIKDKTVFEELIKKKDLWDFQIK